MGHLPKIVTREVVSIFKMIYFKFTSDIFIRFFAKYFPGLISFVSLDTLLLVACSFEKN